MDRIFINNLTVETIIGIYDEERNTPQRVTLHLEMAADIAHAASTEDINTTLNYQALSETLIEFLKNSRFLLIETMAERVTELVRRDFAVSWVKLTLHMPDALPGDIDVGVIIERGQKS